MNIDQQVEQSKKTSEEMKSLFLPYNLAKIAKTIGFNYPCFAFYWDQDWNDKETFHYTVKYSNHNVLPSRVSAPLYDQIITWFEKVHHKIIEDTLYYSYNEQKWAVGQGSHMEQSRENDILSTMYESKPAALNALIIKHFNLIQYNAT